MNAHLARRVAILIFSVTLLTGLSGCQLLQEFFKEAFQRPTLKFQGLKLHRVSFKGMTLDFHFRLNNPNSVGCTFSSLAYKLEVDGNTLFKGRTRKAIQLRANGSSPFSLPLSVEFRKFVRALAAFFQKRSSVPYRISLGFGFRTPIGDIELPFSHAGNVQLPRLPKVRVAGAKLGSISLTGARVDFSFDLSNEGKFPVTLSGLQYSIRLAGAAVGGGRARSQVLAAGKSRRVTVPLRLSFLSLGFAVVRVIKSKRVPYGFNGKIDLGLFSQPFALKGVLNF